VSCAGRSQRQMEARVLSHILSRPAFATNTARSPSGGHGGGVHVCGIEIPYRLTVYGMSGIGTEEPIDVTHQVVGFLGCS